MKKEQRLNLNKELIIETTLALINKEQGIYNINLREIGRILGCAHTNLYNYFAGLSDLLWQTVDEAAVRFRDAVIGNIDRNADRDQRIAQFFTNYLDFYLANKGSFKLLWFEQVGGQRPKESLELSYRIVDELTATLTDICDGQISSQEAHYLLHTVHCYLHGEITIFISGRGLITKEPEFRLYVRKECLKLFTLLMDQTLKDRLTT